MVLESRTRHRHARWASASAAGRAVVGRRRVGRSRLYGRVGRAGVLTGIEAVALRGDRRRFLSSDGLRAAASVNDGEQRGNDKPPPRPSVPESLCGQMAFVGHPVIECKPRAVARDFRAFPPAPVAARATSGAAHLAALRLRLAEDRPSKSARTGGRGQPEHAGGEPSSVSRTPTDFVRAESSPRQVAGVDGQSKTATPLCGRGVHSLGA